MNLYLIVGNYGAGKSTLLSGLNDDRFDKISLDEIDLNSRERVERIKIINGLFNETFGIQINFERFNELYTESITRNKGSLFNTLCDICKINSIKINSDVLREKILIPSILTYFKQEILAKHHFNKDLVVDAGALHFIGMDNEFFMNLSNVKVIYLNVPQKKIIGNLLNHDEYFKRGIFRKEIDKLGVKDVASYLARQINSTQIKLNNWLETTLSHVVEIRVEIKDTPETILRKFNLIVGRVDSSRPEQTTEEEEFLSLKQHRFNTIVSIVRTLSGEISMEQETDLTGGKETSVATPSLMTLSAPLSEAEKVRIREAQALLDKHLALM